MIDMIAGWLESAIRATPEGSRTIVAIQILLWVSAVISGVLDNIPYTITMGAWAGVVWCGWGGGYAGRAGALGLCG